MAEPTPEDKIKLNVIVEGDDPSEKRFKVTVSLGDEFEDVGDIIQQVYWRKQQISLYGLRLYRAKLPAEQAKRTRLSNEGFLPIDWLVESVWPSRSEVDRRLIHIIVRAASRQITITHRAATPPPPETEFQKISNDFNKNQSDFVECVRKTTRSASLAAQPKNLRQQPNINLARPANKPRLPIVLYHPVFGDFLTQLQSIDPIESELYIHTWQYFPFSQDSYETETRNGARDILYLLLEQVLKVKTDGVKVDGELTGPNGAYLTIMEMKNKIDMGSSDPSIQVAQLYTRYWSEPTAQSWLDWCCCPSILIAIAGPWISVLGAIFLDRPVVQPLADFLWVGQDQTQPLDHIARVFGCIRQAQDKLSLYYSKPPAFSSKNPARAFPYLTHYTDSTGQTVHFTYQKNLCPENSEKNIFLAETINEENPESIVVKFVQSYNAEAHKLLAEHQLAPELLYDGTMYPEHQPGMYRSMIVMKLVQGVDLRSMETSNVPRSVFEDIDRAMQLLHKHDLVFGDLREPNVMVLQDSIGKATGKAMLIDFDWCGKHGEGRYPSKIRMELVWHKDVGPGTVMDKEHDTFMQTRLRGAFRVSPC